MSELEGLPEPAELHRRLSRVHALDWGPALPGKAQILAESGPLATRSALRLLAAIDWRDAAATKDLVALSAPTAELYQLKHRIKSPHSLARKIKSLTGRSQQEPTIEDVQRYTIASPDHDQLVAVAKRAVEHLQERGWRLAAVRNSYVAGSRYKGLHLATRDSRGQRIEVQLQSYAALAVKEATTRPYEVARNRELPRSVREAARRECVRLTESLRTPRGLDDLTELGGCPVRVAGYGLGHEGQRSRANLGSAGGPESTRPGKDTRATWKGLEQ